MNYELRYRTCNLCEALCGLEIKVKDNAVLSIRGDDRDVFSKGHICPKAVALKDIHDDPDRLKRPVIKRNHRWEEISWEVAFETTARRLTEIQNAYGLDAVGIYQGNPSVHNLGTALFAPMFVRNLKTKNRFSATSVDQLGHHLAAELMFGHMNLMPVPDIDRTNYWLIIGGNPVVSNGSIMTAPNVSGRIRAIQKRGGKVIVVDPRRTETAKKADVHHFITPGTDTLLLLALIKHVLETEMRIAGHLSPMILNEEILQVKQALNDLDYDHVSGITGIEKSVIKQIAHNLLQQERAVCYGRLGVSASKYGALNHWAINFLNIITGNFDVEGGAMLADPAVPVAVRKSKNKRFNRWRSRVRGLPETGGELPSATMAEEITTPGKGQIRAMITSCGNPVLSTPNGRKLDMALGQLDFMVSVDIYINETTRHADIILPPATGLETPHYGLAFHNLAVRNSAKYSPPVIDKSPGSKYDWEIYQDLSRAISCIRGEDYMDSNLTPEWMLSQALSSGKRGFTFDDLLNKPHGIDLGPLRPVLSEKIMTDDGKIELFPEPFKNQLHKVFEEDPPQGNLLLIGRRDLRSNNSWMHNSHRLVKGPKRCTLLLHPADADRLAIEDKEEVMVYSDVGEVCIEVELCPDIKPGVVCIPHGWGHNRENVELKIAKAHAGVSFNDLVDDQLVDPLTGVAIINAVAVNIRKTGEPVTFQ